ncbi:glutamate-5-semialdehyde dehydrogenase [Bacteriovoracaceae bacterium]|nr:glutamate-5-semialdehyde dehydrogenase [Bacteriovoracaceae bacterium]
MSALESTLKKAKESTLNLPQINLETRVRVLNKLKDVISQSVDEIIDHNKKDLELGQEKNLSSALIDRLLLDPKRIQSMINMIDEIANANEVVGLLTPTLTRENGLEIFEETIPLGLIGMIFESRPNVMIDLASLCLKTCNGFVAKGGKEAGQSNKILYDIFIKSCQDELNTDAFVMLDSTDRSLVTELLKFHQYVDLIIPRGGESLVSYVRENSTIPVIAHEKGLCHLYFDQKLDEKIALDVLLNGKVSRPGVCNAIETLVLHQSHLETAFLQKILKLLSEHKVEVFTEKIIYDKFCSDYSNLKLAQTEQWDQEYLDLKLSLKIVPDVNQAIQFIQKHSSRHTEVIISEDKSHQEIFRKSLDSSCIAINTSSRFNDGGELGLGSELGISTSKLHAYGPMGLKHLVTRRFFLMGRGQVRI